MGSPGAHFGSKLGSTKGLTEKIDELIDETPNAYPHVSVDDVVRLRGIAQTKRNKKDSKSVFYTDHFINSNLLLRVFLSMLFSSLIVHGFTPIGW